MDTNKNNTVYIVGHRNPDMDSLCSALGYAALKNLVDPRKNYIAVRCSHLSDGPKRLLKELGITPPPYMHDVYPKVSDVMLQIDRRIEASDTLMDFARNYKPTDPSAIPVFEGERYLGLLTEDDIVAWTMQKLCEEGTITGGPRVSELLQPGEPRLDKEENYFSAKAILKTSSRRGLPVFDGESCIGYITRRCFMDIPKYNVILVDHNETSQSIQGIETANVLEIIDHHRLNALKTELPLLVDAEPLGSSCTIVYQQFLRNGIRPDRMTAKILLAGIISDTLILHSPTTTMVDKNAADFLAAICGEEVEAFGRRMFSSSEGLRNRDPEAAITSDFKVYQEQNAKVGIGQCEVTTLQDLDEYAEVYMAALEKVCRSGGLDWALLMITDVLKEHSILLSTDYKSAKALPYAQLGKGRFDMPDVMSRKKQLLPEVLHALAI